MAIAIASFLPLVGSACNAGTGAVDAVPSGAPIAWASSAPALAPPVEANQASLQFLKSLDDIMADYVSASTSDDETAIQYRIDDGWAERMAPPKPTYGCFYANDGTPKSGSSRSECESDPGARFSAFRGVWRRYTPVKSSVYLYSGTKEAPTRPPELMARLANKGVTLPEKLLCKAASATTDKTGTLLVCEGSPRSMLRLTGALAGDVSVGDTVQVPLSKTRRDPQGVLLRVPRSQLGQTTWFWTVDADAKSLAIVEKASSGALLLRGAGRDGSPTGGASAAPGATGPVEPMPSGDGAHRAKPAPAGPGDCTEDEFLAAQQNGFSCAGWQCLQSCVMRKGFPSGSCFDYTDRLAECQRASNDCTGQCRSK